MNLTELQGFRHPSLLAAQSVGREHAHKSSISITNCQFSQSSSKTVTALRFSRVRAVLHARRQLGKLLEASCPLTVVFFALFPYRLKYPWDGTPEACSNSGTTGTWERDRRSGAPSDWWFWSRIEKRDFHMCAVIGGFFGVAPKVCTPSMATKCWSDPEIGAFDLGSREWLGKRKSRNSARFLAQRYVLGD
jgi:hypothetical protein